MPIKGASLAVGGTISVTGGTAKTFTDMGETIKNGVKVADLSQPDARIRTTITAINRPAITDRNGKFISKDRRSTKTVMPKILADGSIAYNFVESVSSIHPETTDAERAQLLGIDAQLKFNTDLTNFQLYGSVS